MLTSLTKQHLTKQFIWQFSELDNQHLDTREQHSAYRVTFEAKTKTKKVTDQQPDTCNLR